MSSRQQQKAEAREKRIAAQHAAEESARKRRLIRLGALAAAAVAAVVTIALLAGGGDDGSGTEKADEGTTPAAETQKLFAGIPQDGTTLGDPKAKVVLTEYADLQCPFCAEYTTDVLPELIETYVRPGKLRLELRLLRILGPDSDRGANAAHVAAQTDRMWQFTDLWYRNQGTEHSGYGDDDFITGLAEEAGLSAEKAVAAATNGSQFQPIEQAEAEAEAHGIDSTPSFLIGSRAGEGRPVEVSELTFEAFEAAIAPELE